MSVEAEQQRDQQLYRVAVEQPQFKMEPEDAIVKDEPREVLHAVTSVEVNKVKTENSPSTTNSSNGKCLLLLFVFSACGGIHTRIICSFCYEHVF